MIRRTIETDIFESTSNPPSQHTLQPFVSRKSKLNRGFIRRHPDNMKSDLSPPTNIAFQEANPSEIISPKRSTFEPNQRRILSISDYELGPLIGKGTQGSIYISRDINRRQEDKLLAIKVLSSSDQSSTITKFLIQQELEILNSLDSHYPFVSTYYGNFLIQEKFTALVFEFIPGGTLLDLLLDKFYSGLDEDQAKFYVSELLLALDHLHSKFIAFRDLKCDNVMIGADGHIKLIDFGLAARAQDEFQVAGEKRRSSHHSFDSFNDPEEPFSTDLREEDWCRLAHVLIELLGEKFKQKDVSESCDEFIDRLLDKSAGPISFEDIINYDWLKGIDWEKVKNLKSLPPYVPEVDHLSRYEDASFDSKSWEEIAKSLMQQF